MKTLRDLMDLSNRVAVVTGGAGTLGLAFCESLAELGATVCILDISEQRAQERAQQIAQRFPVRTWAVGADITIESDVDQAVHRIVEKHGRLDILVNNAAYSPRNLPTDGFPLEGQNLAQWDAQLAVILTGTFLVSRACARPLANHAKGTIINIASIYGLVGPVPSLYAGTALVNEAHYAAGKGGIVQ